MIIIMYWFIDYLSIAVINFGMACASFEKELMNTSSLPNISEQLNIIRILNNKLMNVERAFIHPEGLPGRFYYI